MINCVNQEKPESERTDEEAVKYFKETLIRKLRGKGDNYCKEISRSVLEKNYYTEENILSVEESIIRNSSRIIYSIIKNGRKLYASVDHENFRFEMCNEQGHHLESCDFLGNCDNKPKRQNSDKKKYNRKTVYSHDIWALA